MSHSLSLSLLPGIDFAFFGLEITGGRLVSGFGGAIKLSALTLPSLFAVGVPL
jgi:hypothetical protein